MVALFGASEASYLGLKQQLSQPASSKDGGLQPTSLIGVPSAPQAA
jgi:hypothetical protein